jgi:hypothetical protein
MAGTPLQTVAELLGHSDIRMTLRYAHLLSAHLRGKVDRVRFGTPAAPFRAPAAELIRENSPGHRTVQRSDERSDAV